MGGAKFHAEILVRSRGLEPPRLAALAPQASASASSATTAMTSIVEAIKEAVKPGEASEENKRAASPTGSGQAEGRVYKTELRFLRWRGCGLRRCGRLRRRLRVGLRRRWRC